MINKIILASRSGVRKKILNQNGINCDVIPADIDEDQVKQSLLDVKATPEIISKNLAELKANKVSKKKPNEIIFGCTGTIGEPFPTNKLKNCLPELIEKIKYNQNKYIWVKAALGMITTDLVPKLAME